MAGFRYIRGWGMLAALCASLLTGCSSTLATQGSDPYTADDVIAMVEKKFAVCNPHLICTETQVEKEKPFERRIYVLHDAANDFTFSCNAVARRSRAPVRSGTRMRSFSMRRAMPRI